MCLRLVVNDCKISFDCELNIEAWLIIKSVLNLTDIPRSVVLQIFAQRPTEHGICIHINAIQLHLMIFPKSDNGWDDLLKSTKEVSLVKPLNRSKPNHIVIYNHTDLGMFGIDMGAQARIQGGGGERGPCPPPHFLGKKPHTQKTFIKIGQPRSKIQAKTYPKTH